jgi:hypothetical protein
MGNKYNPENSHIPIGALVRVNIIKRREDLAIVIDKNVGLLENTWYMVHSLSTGKEYMAYPHEVLWLTDKNRKDGEDK